MSAIQSARAPARPAGSSRLGKCAAHESIPHSRLVLLPRAAHFPNLEDPAGLAGALADWIADTRPYRLSDADWAELIASRTVRSRRLRAA